MTTPDNPCYWLERLLEATEAERESFRAEVERLRERLAESERCRGELRTGLVECEAFLEAASGDRRLCAELLGVIENALEHDAAAGGQT